MAGSASGFNGNDIFDGEDLIREAKGGVVVVIIQYRLALFRFLPGAKVKQGGALISNSVYTVTLFHNPG